MARSKLTPAVHKAIVTMVSSGAFIETACAAVGIAVSTYYDWLKRAGDPNEKDPRYLRFSEATARARADFETRMIDVIQCAAPSDWRAGAWLAERSFPTRYSNMRKVEVTGKDGGPITLAGLEALMGIDDTEDDA